MMMAACQSRRHPRRVDIGGGREMYLECRGSGSPTVVLVAGGGERGENWSATASPDQTGVFPEVAKFSRVCVYDRPGTATETSSGWDVTASTEVAQPITPADAAADLHALLEASGEAGPYVLVGHSLGGPIVRYYAGEYPSTVAGVVLDDGLSEHLGDRLTPEQLVDFERLNSPEVQGVRQEPRRSSTPRSSSRCKPRDRCQTSRWSS